MKKCFITIIMFLLMTPIFVSATNANSAVWSGSNIYTCTSKYQDTSVLINDSIYFSHCMEARSNGSTYFYTDDRVVCKNNNKDPYVKPVNTSKCDNLNVKNGEIMYCSVILHYDCTKTSSGSSFTTTTKSTTTKTTKKTTKKTSKVTTKVTTTVESNKKLKSLSLSGYTILFNPEVYQYNINVPSHVTSINVTAVPQDTTSKVEIINNTNIVNGSVIKVIVRGTDNKSVEYIINVQKQEEIKKSSNANLSNLTIKEYDIIFDKTINDYNILLNKGVSSLTLNYQVEDTKSSVRVEGNSDIKNGSMVKVIVTAEDSTENIYTISVKVKEKSSVIKYLFIILLILAILAGAYYVYIKLVREKKSGAKYEYE